MARIKRPGVVLYASGNDRIGAGHLARTAALAAALTARLDAPHVRLLWQCTEDAATRFDTGSAEVITTSTPIGVAVRLGLLARAHAPVIYVTDGLHSPVWMPPAVRALGFSAVAFLNDSSRAREAGDLLVDSDGFKSASHAPPGFKGLALMGANYQILRSALVAQRPESPWSEAAVQRILFTLGSADPGHLTAPLLSTWLETPESRAVSSTVVVGPYFSGEHRRALQQMAAKHPVGRITLLDSPPDLVPYMATADLVVGLGGITAYEAMCLGKPVAALAWRNMRPYVEALDQAGLLTNLGVTDTTAAVARAARGLANCVSNPSRLANLARHAFNAVDGKGADRVADSLIQLLRRFHTSAT